MSSVLSGTYLLGLEEVEYEQTQRYKECYTILLHTWFIYPTQSSNQYDWYDFGALGQDHKRKADILHREYA